MNRHTRIFVAGGHTLFGAALKRHLRHRGYVGLIEADEPDPWLHTSVQEHFCEHRPEVVFLASGLSGGIGLNLRQPATLMHDNLLTICHLLEAAHRYKVKRLLYLGSACMYPRDAEQPLQVESLGTGKLEPTSAAYATARYAGVVLCEAYRREYGCDFRVAIPANGYGPEDEFTVENGHVIPALIRRFHEAKQTKSTNVRLWGTGEAVRDFIHADDVADACLFLVQRDEQSKPINIGSGSGIRIKELAETVAEVVGYHGALSWDMSATA
ncbi:MAG: NAD-dependent epimerase/dehydratase family protein, partial [Gemmataceae bacterium]